jgi:hypothetical protein
MDVHQQLAKEYPKIAELLLGVHRDSVLKALNVNETEGSFFATLRVKCESLEGDNYSEKCDAYKKLFENKTDSGYIVDKSVPHPQR